MKPLFAFLLIYAHLNLSAQDGSYNLGARNLGLAGIGTTLTGPFSHFNNIGGLGYQDKTSVGISYRNQYNIQAFRSIGLGFIQPFDRFNLGLSFFRFGDDLFSQQKIGFGLGNKIGMVALGIGGNVIQYQIETIGSKQVLVLEFGGIVDISPKVKFGAHVFNLNTAAISEQEYIPVGMKLGLSIIPTPELQLHMEIRKHSDAPTSAAIGLEYQIVKHVFARTGFDPLLKNFAFGIGVDVTKFMFDYGYNIRNPLGAIHEISLATKI